MMTRGILNSVDKAMGLAQSMTYKGLNSIVKRISKIYCTVVRLTKNAMKDAEAQIIRVPRLEKWFLTIFPDSQTG